MPNEDGAPAPTVSDVVRNACESFRHQMRAHALAVYDEHGKTLDAAFKTAITDLVIVVDEATRALHDTANDNARNLARIAEFQNEAQSALAELGREVKELKTRERLVRAVADRGALLREALAGRVRCPFCECQQHGVKAPQHKRTGPVYRYDHPTT